mmetsp:Transcript_6236/g.15045  ORF Transcript_6236/g.15045 Transcript_6236/m.15045 type:complete len:118 (+) Transcript_6236:665-1018(+)
MAVPEAKCYLIMEEHPIEGYPVFATKVCQLEQLLYLALQTFPKNPKTTSNRSDGQTSTDNGSDKSVDEKKTNSHCDQHALRYLLCWMGLVGPFVGLEMKACDSAETVRRFLGQKVDR